MRVQPGENVEIMHFQTKATLCLNAWFRLAELTGKRYSTCENYCNASKKRCHTQMSVMTCSYTHAEAVSAHAADGEGWKKGSVQKGALTNCSQKVPKAHDG